MSAASPLVVPQVNVNDDSVVLVRWVVAPDAVVTAGDHVCDVETTKAASEVVAHASGVLLQQAVAGSRVNVGETLGVIAQTREEAEAYLADRAAASGRASGGVTATPKARALAERNPRIALQAMLALARSTDGQPDVQRQLLEGLDRLEFGKLGADEQCWYLRILTVSAIRHGMYSGDIAAGLVKRLEPHLPSADRRVNEEIVTACAALGSTTIHAKALDLLERSRDPRVVEFLSRGEKQT